jgi:hypothetical protein
MIHSPLLVVCTHFTRASRRVSILLSILILTNERSFLVQRSASLWPKHMSIHRNQAAAPHHHTNTGRASPVPLFPRHQHADSQVSKCRLHNQPAHLHAKEVFVQSLERVLVPLSQVLRILALFPCQFAPFLVLKIQYFNLAPSLRITTLSEPSYTASSGFSTFKECCDPAVKVGKCCHHC